MPFSPVSPGDVLRVGAGVDPYTGEGLNWKERGKEAASTVLLLGAGKTLKTGKALMKVPISDKTIDSVDKGLNGVDAFDDIYGGLKEEFRENK